MRIYKSILIVLAFAGCGFASAQINPYLGLPTDAAALAAKQNSPLAQLGKRIFFDARLSKDGAVSCSSCHLEAMAFADGKVLAEGHSKSRGTRNTPSLFNSAFNTSFFWDGRRETLEKQALDPLTNPMEHGLRDFDEIAAILGRDQSYKKMFKAAFGSEAIDATRVSTSLAAFQRSLLSGNSAFDRFRYLGQADALSASAKRGHALFVGMARCSTCHSVDEKSALFTDQRFHSIGIGRERLVEHLPTLTKKVLAASIEEKDRLIFSDPLAAELGRFVVSGEPKDIGAFRTPSLRNVALTAPYMHDGSVATLEEAVNREVYYRGNEDGRPLILTPQEVEDLVAFLKALTSEALVKK